MDAVASGTTTTTLAVLVRGHLGAKTVGNRVICGTRLNFSDGTHPCFALPTDCAAYGRLSRCLYNRRSASARGKGGHALDCRTLFAFGRGFRQRVLYGTGQV